MSGVGPVTTVATAAGPVSGVNPMPVASQESGAFGEDLIVTPEALVQLKFSTGAINTAAMDCIEHESGTCTVSAGEAVISSGTTTSSRAILRSHDIVHDSPGQGVLARFGVRFTAGVAGTTQWAGIGDEEDGYFVGYNGADYSVMRRTGGAVEIRTLTITAGAVSDPGTITITLDDEAQEVEVSDGDTIGEVCTAIAAVDWASVAGGWRAFDMGNRVVFEAIDTETRDGTYSFVDTDTTGTAGSIAQTVTAVAATDDPTAQASFVDSELGAANIVVDPTLGNICEIEFQGGYGDTVFKIEDPMTGRFVTLHRIRYANANTAPSVERPDLHLFAEVNNGSTTSNMTLWTTDLSGFRLGPENVEAELPFAQDATKSVGTTETVLLTIQNKAVFNSKSNRVVVFVDELSVSNDGSKVGLFEFYRNAGLVGAPSWTDEDANSTMEYDSAATAVAGGTKIRAPALTGGPGAADIDIPRERRIVLDPGDRLTITGRVSSGSSANLTAGIGWREAQ